MKLIIFDMSNVCSNAEEPIFLKKFMKKYGLPEVFEHKYYELEYKSETGEIGMKKVWEQLIKEFNLKESPEEIIKAVMKEKVFYPEILNIAKNLRTKYKVVCFTNYPVEYYLFFKETINEYFDKVFVSYQMNTRKPKPEGFKIILNEYKVKPEETIFIDDTEKNVNQTTL